MAVLMAVRYHNVTAEPVETLEGEVRICGSCCGLELYVDPDGNGCISFALRFGCQHKSESNTN